MLLSGFFVHSQMVVNDPAVTAGVAKMNVGILTSISKATAQVKVAMDQYSTYQKEISKLKKVASVIQQGKVALTVLDNFKLINNELGGIKEKLSKVDPKYRAVWARNVDNLVSEIYVVTESSSIVLKQNLIEMNDAERFKSLMDVYELSNKLRTKAGELNRKLDRML